MKKPFSCTIKLSQIIMRDPHLFNNLVIATGLMVKCVFSMP
ncbi:hypothetical protein BTN50_0875 [Candidatus Enterovibrio altilux]|uniref:Uncharacterized protein n=1 Tax=Candidatus Enterovibrio altilux TaxID=1927128 RepID=A0A291B8S1_9GAMM|nr:hypothetical protein BTN50_0875 [Candidatus Enterovibrio luxaltus]